MKTAVCLLLFSTLVAAPTAAQPAVQTPDTLVVCPREFLPALRPWLVHRMQQGHRVAVTTDTGSAEAIQKRIRLTAKSGTLRHVMIVGDDHPKREAHARLKELTVPAPRIEAKINVKFGSEPHIGGDNSYADLDDDHTPDLAIGRLPVDTPEQLTAVVRKIIEYETQPATGPWRRRINITAGVGGFGVVADSIIEMATKKFITGDIPSGYQTKMTYASLSSPYCPDPRRLPQTLIQRHNEGCLFWVYIGHGQRQWLDFMQVEGQWHRIFDTREIPQLDADAGNPIVVMLACYTGAFDEEKDCLSEMMLTKPGGPVAVISGSRVTMPYANTVFGQALLQQYFHEQHKTLGELVLAAKRETMEPVKEASDRTLIDALGRAFSPTGKQLDEERREHLYLYNLIGDPLLRIAKPQPVKVTAPKTATASRAIDISGVSPIGGECLIEIVCRRDRTRFDPPNRRGQKATPELMTQLQATYEQANDQVWGSLTKAIRPGEFSARFHLPENCIGPCHVRVYVKGEKHFALGSADVYVHSPREDDDPFEAPPE